MTDVLIEYYPDQEDLEIKEAIEAMEDVAEDPEGESIEIQGWFSSLKKYAKKAVKKAVKTVVPSPVRKVLSIADKATGGFASKALKTAIPAALTGFTSINPVTGGIIKLSTKMFDELDTLGKTKGKKVKFTAQATGNVARTFYEKGRRDANSAFMKKLFKMSKQELELLRRIAKQKAPQIIAAQQNQQAAIAQKQQQAGLSPKISSARAAARTRVTPAPTPSSSRRRRR